VQPPPAYTMGPMGSTTKAGAARRQSFWIFRVEKLPLPLQSLHLFLCVVCCRCYGKTRTRAATVSLNVGCSGETAPH
jgi:hypothetical protein